ncbi:MAG: iron-sulfur cluster assembly scaffold protein [Candidatus Komeilibacteria bacterium]
MKKAIKKTNKKADLRDQAGQSWFYSPVVKEHFFSPHNILMPGEEKKFQADGAGYVGSPACGDMMKMFIKVKQDKIVQCKWQTFGCASAIASTSMLSVMVTEKGGITLDKARKIRPQDIMNRLGGLPTRKIHCSVLGDKALRAAINDYLKKTKQYERVEVEGGRLIDKVVKVTDKDIEEAVLDGAVTLTAVQDKTKVGTGDPDCLPEVEELIHFYKEKYFG